MLTTALALMPFLLKWAPAAASAIGSALGGGKGKEVATQAAEAVVDVVGGIFGTTQPDELERLAKSDPAKAAELRMQMQTTRLQIDLAFFQASLADVASARALAAQTPLIAKTQVALTVATSALFGVVLILVFTGNVAQEVSRFGDIMLGTLGTIFVMQMQFFFGNSTSGHSANNASSSALSALIGKATAPIAAITAPDPVASVTDKSYIERTIRQPMADAPGAADQLNGEQLR
jgi:hypothetical protein